MVFHRRLSDSKPPLVYRTFLKILGDLNNAVVWTVSARPLISISSSLLTKFLRIVPNVLITIGITVTLIFHSFFQLSGKVQIIIIFSFKSFWHQL